MRLISFVCCVLFAATPLCAQEPLSIGQAVEQALRTYPAVRASLEQVAAAAAGTNVARTAYLPRVDFLGQINRATRNNVLGLLLPQAVIPAISGPVLGLNDFASVWGSAAGVLVTWEPFDFGLRQANVESAGAVRAHSEADLAVTRLQVSTAAADAFLTLLAARQAAESARAAVTRAEVLDRVVGARVRSGLRPGADAARAGAELAVAQTQLVRAEEATAVAQAGLAALVGWTSGQGAIDPGPLLGSPPAEGAPSAPLSAHPLARQRQAAVEVIRRQEHALERSYFPRFALQGSSFARGTGARVDGTTGGAAAGLAPDTGNWAVGLTVTFAALDFPSIRARKEVQAHRELSETAQYDRVLQDLQGRLEQALARYRSVQRVAGYTPIELQAARAAEEQAVSRYDTGLGNIVEVAEAQRLLTQAEIDDTLARLGVWQALLAVTAAQGDVAPFLQSAAR